jgi:ABC transport system ATP-binding/permease protein
MALLINCQEISKAFGAAPLFEDVTLTVSDGDRLGLIGPNGAGKSTLLQILAGAQEPDRGIRSVRKLVRVGYVPQDSVFAPGLTVNDLLTPETLGKAGFSDGSAEVASLSGGWKKRVSIAQELAREPDILLLDEPTNHLDLEGIAWLERLLISAPFASVIVSHDRYFLENVATGMAELSRQYPSGLFRTAGNYSEFLSRREEFLGVQAKRQEALKNKVATEVEWLRRGAKARTTKSKARIDAAGRLIGELADVSSRNQTSVAKLDFNASDRKTKKLIELVGIEKSFGSGPLFRGLDITLAPGRRIGLAGANGTGKSTLLRIIRGEILPDAGEINRADNVRVVYFDQNREQLQPEITLRRALAPHGDSVIYQDQPVHVASWARRFLFRSEQLEMPVGRLSGGEKARVLIARLMLQPADVLLLDEPTNDLDIPTLEVLEENLTEFRGALVLVTHDRFMLDRVSNLILGLDGDGGAQAFAEYSQWEQSQNGRKQPRNGNAKQNGDSQAETRAKSVKKRLSYLEAREWETIEALVHAAEAHLAEKENALQDPAVNTNPELLQKTYDESRVAATEVDRLYSRWAELSDKASDKASD